MTQNSNKVYAGMELIDLLLNHTESIQTWPITTQGTESHADFLDSLLDGSESSSASASPLWSPCPSDSGVSEDPPSDHLDSPHPPASPAFQFQAFCPQPLLQSQPAPGLHLDNTPPDISIDLGWDSGLFPEVSGLAQCLSVNHVPRLAPAHPLTVKGLLLSGLGEKAQRSSQNSLQELVLNEDEKKLLAKEGVNLPDKLPMSKYEERVLKKIRRKIRNKQSAQESRRKKREYVDGLEGRMAVCSAHNLELQRKVELLEQSNTSLLDQLGRLQERLTNVPNKTAKTGTCILVLLLSLSFFLSPSLQPDPYSQASQASDFTQTRVQSRSLQHVEDTGTSPPPPTLSLARAADILATLLSHLHVGPGHADTDPPTSHRHDHKHPL